MIALFRYSEAKYSKAKVLIGGVGLHCLAAFGMTSLFAWLTASRAIAGNLSHGLFACAVGLEAGYFCAGLIWPLSDRRMIEIALGAIVFALFYWGVSVSTPDRLIAQAMFGSGGGILAATAFRRVFLSPPVFPRVP